MTDDDESYLSELERWQRDVATYVMQERDRMSGASTQSGHNGPPPPPSPRPIHNG